MPLYNKNIVNPNYLRLMDGSPVEKLGFMMNNLTDVYFDNITGIDDLGTFDGNVLSGLGLEDNTGGSLSELDGKVVNGYLYLAVQPKTKHRQSAGDIRLAKDRADAIDKALKYKTLYYARSRYKINGSISIPFSQEIKCYYSQGSHKTNNYSDLIFDIPPVIQADPSFDIVKTLGFSVSTQSYFDNATPFLLGTPSPTEQLDEDNIMKKFANELEAAGNSVGGIGIDSNLFNASVQNQLDFWKGKKESSSEPQYSMLNSYWTKVGWGPSEWTPGGKPWSAAFISFQLWPYGFKPAASHYMYTDQIIKGQSLGWKAFSLTKGKAILNIGDVLIRPRGNSIPSEKPYWYTHGDVVYKIEGGNAFLAGGNLGDTAKIAAKIRLDSSGIAQDTKNYIVILKKTS